MVDRSLKLVDEERDWQAARLPSGLFHVVNDLVPDGQELVTVPPDASVEEAMQLMRDHDYSQLPVLSGPNVLGLFSYRSLASHLPTAKQRVLDRDVEDLSDEPDFARVTDDLQDILPTLNRREAVLVGDPDNLLGVVTPTDVAAHLMDVTQPFILLKEIELSLRWLVRSMCPSGSLQTCIGSALGHQYGTGKAPLPTDLDQLTLRELVEVVLNNESYREFFLTLFGRDRSTPRSHLMPIPEIRNAVLHFRGDPSYADVDQLLSTRAWLQRKVRRLGGSL
ncbi:CBS domain-containing protein [Aquihabitans daechungensis]|uniref:CBS domain-containing protein n=1 Tax=Aquihabitans daechungensis TaxID=1052257 RepID=UPI003B9F9383